MLTQAIGALLPAAVAVALSPIPIIAVILMLDTPRARSNGPAFALGWVIGLVAVSAIVLVAASGADDPSSASATGVNWVQVAIGLLFIGMARRQWAKRPAKGEQAEMPSWMATIDEFTPGRSLVLGAALSGVNPKNLALTASASAAIAQAGLSGSDTLLAELAFIVIGSITVVGAVLFYLVATEKATAALGPIKEFMAEHNAVIMMVILLLLGVKILGEGIGAIAV